MPFKALGLSPNTVQAVGHAGYEHPTPIQVAAIPAVLEGVDLIGIAQTGTGKTAAFVLPMIERLSKMPRNSNGRLPRALILAPTRELAAQIDEAFGKLSRQNKLSRVAIYGGVSEQPQISALRRGVDVVIATPGRLIDLMERHADLSGIRIAVLDEADRMLDMGFLPQIRRVVAALPRERQTLLFSATLSREIEQITREFLKSPKLVEIGNRSPVSTVEHVLYSVPKSRKLDLLLRLLTGAELESVLVFSRTKHGADKIARKLESSGISTGTLHSNRSQSQRQSALAAFRAGRVRVLVATDIAARGIDVADISHVVNFDFPPQPEDYIHRIGRTGRASATGDAISFVTADDEDAVRALERIMKRKIERRTVPGFDYHESQIVSTRPHAARPHASKPHAPRPHASKPHGAKSSFGRPTRPVGAASHDSRRPVAPAHGSRRPSAPPTGSRKSAGSRKSTRWSR